MRAVEPDGATVDAMGFRPLDGERTRRVLTTAFLGTASQVVPDLRTLLRGGAHAERVR